MEHKHDLVLPLEAERWLDGISYPADKDDLVDHAERRGASLEVMRIIRKLPKRIFWHPAEVNQEIGLQEALEEMAVLFAEQIPEGLVSEAEENGISTAGLDDEDVRFAIEQREMEREWGWA